MKIGLLDIDCHNFPSLPLMKISAYHKKRGDKVEFVNFFDNYDTVYISKVFTFTPDIQYPINANEIIKGGTGYGLKNRLSNEIEPQYPDYSLYNITDTAYGFLTRGCPRRCPFCVVSDKEGTQSRKVADLTDFWRGQKHIKLLDANLLTAPERIELLMQLSVSGAYIDFTQGLDIRLMTSDITDIIKQCKIKTIYFAWDNMRDSELILRNLINFKVQTQYHYTKLGVYVLTNYDTDFEFDLYRVYMLKSIGYDPYVMIYNKDNAEQKYKDLQRWVNNKIIFRSGNAERFEDYIKAGMFTKV